MKANQIVLSLALILSTLFTPVKAKVPEFNNKPVEAVLEFYPNYTGHLLSVATVDHSYAYARQYRHTIVPADLAYLKDHIDLLKWSEGDEGMLTYFFVTFPGYVNPASKTHLAEYLTDLNSAVAARSFDSFKEKYAYFIREMDKWNGFNENTQIFSYAEEIQRLSGIWMNNYDRFRQEVWPEFEGYMVRLSAALNEKFDSWNLIREWEKRTGLTYDAPYYRVILSIGMNQDLCGKTFGYEKQCFGIQMDPKDLIHTVCRQAGLRMLSGLCASQYPAHDPSLCFMVYESMADYVTDQIFADLGLGEKITPRKRSNQDLYSIFDVIHQINPGIALSEVYAIALDTYSRASFASTGH